MSPRLQKILRRLGVHRFADLNVVTPRRDREIFLLRLGAQDNRPWTLEEVGAKFRLTRERVRQVVGKTVVWLKKTSNGQEPAVLRRGKLAAVAGALEALLQDGQHRLPVQEAFRRIRGRPRMRTLNVADFLEALKRSNTVTIDFARPDQPAVRLRRLRLIDVGKGALVASNASE